MRCVYLCASKGCYLRELHCGSMWFVRDKAKLCLRLCLRWCHLWPSPKITTASVAQPESIFDYICDSPLSLAAARWE